MMKIFDYPSPLWKLYAWVVGIFILFTVPLYATFLLITQSFMSAHMQTRVVRNWNRLVLFMFRIKTNVKGLENYDPHQAALVVSNHQSMMDIPVVYHILEGHLRMVAKAELFKIPFFGHGLKAAGYIPIVRTESRSGAVASNLIKEKLSQGQQIWLAPEGTRSKNGEILAFKRGSFAIAIETQMPIQPILIKNAYQVLNKNEWLPRVGKSIDVEILPLVSTQGLNEKDKSSLSDRVRTQLIDRMNAQG